MNLSDNGLIFLGSRGGKTDLFLGWKINCPECGIHHQFPTKEKSIYCFFPDRLNYSYLPAHIPKLLFSGIPFVSPRTRRPPIDLFSPSEFLLFFTSTLIEYLLRAYHSLRRLGIHLTPFAAPVFIGYQAFLYLFRLQDRDAVVFAPDAIVRKGGKNTKGVL